MEAEEKHCLLLPSLINTTCCCSAGPHIIESYPTGRFAIVTAMTSTIAITNDYNNNPLVILINCETLV